MVDVETLATGYVWSGGNGWFSWTCGSRSDKAFGFWFVYGVLEANTKTGNVMVVYNGEVDENE